jgi:hypothetical protein
MKKSPPNLYEIIRKIRVQLETPVSSERLHAMMNELMCALYNEEDEKKKYSEKYRLQ